MAFDFTSFTQSIEKTLAHIVGDISTLRTGRATSQLLDPVTVEAYGTRMKLAEVANVSAPDATLLTVSPWDKSLIGAIEKAISSSGLNFSPVVDGDLIRIVVPALTEERRKEMVKLLHQKIESGRVMLRNVRTDTKKDIDKQKGQPGISEDDISADIKKIDDLLKDALAKLDTLLEIKEKELMKV